MLCDIWKTVRLCRRCRRWRSVGNFTHYVYKGKHYNSRTCRRCWTVGMPNENRNWWVVTDKGRAALREMERAA